MPKVKQKSKGFSPYAFIAITLLIIVTIFPVGLVSAQSGYWDITVQFNEDASFDESGVSVVISMSGNSVLHLTTTGQQVSGSGNGNYALSMSGNANTGQSTGTISAQAITFTETNSVTGIANSDGTVTLTVTTTTTNAPSTMTGTMTTTVAGQTVTTPITVPINSLTQTTSGNYQTKLQDGYSETTPISVSTSGVRVTGSVNSSVARRLNPSPSAASSLAPSPTESTSLGTVGLLRGSAAIMDPNTGVDLPLTSNQGVLSGSIVKTSTDSVLEFRYPSSDTVVDLGSDSQLQFVGIQQQNSADGTLKLDATVPPLPNLYTGPYEEGLIDDGLGPLGFFLGGIHGAKGVIVEGILYLIEGVGHFRGHSADSAYMEPIAVNQGYIIPMGTEYIVSTSSQGTTINVITGPLVFLDWRSGNTVTLESGQSLNLHNAGEGGFTSQQLQVDVYNFNTDSVNQWWDVAAVSETAPKIPLLIIVVVVVAIVAVLIAVLALRRRKKALSKEMLPPPPPPPPPP